MAGKEVVTFMADGAEDALARFVRWAGIEDVDDLGVLDGWHRYRLDSALWSEYVRAATARR